MSLSEKITEIELPQVLEEEGIQLRRSGKGYQFICPFHDDRNPSGSVYPKFGKWLWHCFGCQAGGDAVDWIINRHGLGFRDACRHLGIESRSLSRTQKASIKKKQAIRNTTDAFRAWLLAAIDELRDTISTAYQISSRWKTVEGFERGCMILDPIADLQGQLDVLIKGPMKDQICIYSRWKLRGGFF